MRHGAATLPHCRARRGSGASSSNWPGWRRRSWLRSRSRSPGAPRPAAPPRRSSERRSPPDLYAVPAGRARSSRRLPVEPRRTSALAGRADAPRSGDREREPGRSSRAAVRSVRGARSVRSVRSVRQCDRWGAPLCRAPWILSVPVLATASAPHRPNVPSIRLHPTGCCPSDGLRNRLHRHRRGSSSRRLARCGRQSAVLPAAPRGRDGSLGKVQRASEECTWADPTRRPGRRLRSSTTRATTTSPSTTWPRRPRDRWRRPPSTSAAPPRPDQVEPLRPPPSIHACDTAVTARRTATRTATASPHVVALPAPALRCLRSPPPACPATRGNEATSRPQDPRNDEIPSSPSSEGISSIEIPAATYSPRGPPPKYHRRGRA